MFSFRDRPPVRARHGLAAIFCLWIAACGALPQPFSHDGKVTNPLLAPGERAGINVITVAGMHHGRALADEIAQAFRDEDFAASSSAEPSRGYTLVGQASSFPAADPDAVRVRLLWRLLTPQGRPGGIHHQEALVPRTQWRNGARPVLRRLARDAVSDLAPLLSDPTAAPIARNQPVAVVDVDGAPGDGRISLRRALAFELRKQGFRVAEAAIRGASPIVLMGTVTASPAKSGTQRVAITWSVLSPDGQVLGKIEQANEVTAGSLDKTWGLTAIYAARAAAPGIADIIRAAWRPRGR
ncbi:MAG: hypothetical protein R3229_06490 [Alphaproteobacteria bacterium]|nr:hypothetical protein [Alphaproteobacteria bacterium]